MITEETFNEADGAISGTMSNGEPWEANLFGNCDANLGIWGVQAGDFVCNDIEGFNCCQCGGGPGPGGCGDNKNEINFGPINISAFQGVSLEFSVDGTSDMECGSSNGPCPGTPYDGCFGGNDQIVFYYSIDGGPLQVFEYYCGSQLCFQNIPQVCNLQGTNLSIKLQLGNQATSEYYYLHSLSVYGYTQSPANAIATPSSVCSGQNVQLDEIAGNAVSWSWSGPGGFTSTIKNPVLNNVTLANAGTYTVTITDANGCTSTDQVDITISPSPTASLSGLLEFCPGDCHQINTIISGGSQPYEASFTLQFGPFNIPFTVPGYDVNNQLTICYSGSSPFPGYDLGTNTLTIPLLLTGTSSLTLNNIISADGCSASVIDPDNMTLTFREKLDISTAGPLNACDVDHDGLAVFDLTSLDATLINGQNNVSTEWYEDANCTISISSPGSFSTSTTTVYVYLSHNNAEKCNSDTIPIQLVVIDIPNPGESASLSTCNTVDCVNFWIYLGSDADQGGNWTDNDGTGVDLTFPHCVEFFNVSPGIYTFTYSVQDPAGLCPEALAVLTIEVADPGNPGTDNNAVFCGAPTTPVNLEDLLNNDFDPGGSWSTNSSFNISNPSNVDMSAATVGIYYFYYEIENSPCDAVYSTITIQIIEEPNPGTDNNVTVCNNGGSTVIDLESALGLHDVNGEWIDNDGSGVDLSNPNYVDFDGIDSGVYHYTYIIYPNGTCPQVQAVITVTAGAGANAGSDGSDAICQGSVLPVDLYLYLGSSYDPGGNWTQLSGNSVSLSDPHNVSFSGSPQGSYNFQYAVTGSCGTDIALVTIIINSSFNAGNDYILSLCQNDLINLFDSLKNYNLGGFWIDENNNLVLNPTSVNLDQVKTYTFKYIFSGSNGCPNDTAMATITTTAAVSAGTDGSFLLCGGSPGLINLYSYIGQVYTTGGSWWNINNGTVTASSSTVNFASSPTGLDTFIYIVNGTCGIDTAFLIANITTSPSAGDDYIISICQNSIINLFSALKNFSFGGDWYDQDGNKIADPAKVLLNELKTYTFKYKIPQSGTCLADSAKAEITTLAAPFAGTANDFSICRGSQTLINFFDHLSGNYTTGGIWKFNVTFTVPNPANYNMSTLPPGDYNFSYIVTGNGNCPGDTASLKVTIIKESNPGNDATANVCNSNSNNIIDLDNLIGIHDNIGLWSKLPGNPINISNPKNVNFNNIPAGTYSFTYKINSNGTCPADSAVVTVQVFKKLNAGNDKTLSFCDSDNNKIKIIDQLQPDLNIEYVVEDVQQSQSINIQTLEIDLSKLNVGTYTFILTVGQTHICGPDSSILTLNILKAPLAGTSNNITVCNDDENVNIDNLLGTHDPDGIWTDLDNSGIQIQASNGKNVSFKNISKGTYRFRYRLAAVGSCLESTAVITVYVNPVTQFNLSKDICSGENITVNGKIYNLSNPTGTERLTNFFGCDSIVNIKLSPKAVSAVTHKEDENCFGFGRFYVDNLSGTSLPATLTIDGIGNYQISSIPYTVINMPAGNYTYDITDQNGCNVLDKNFEIKDFIPFEIETDVNQLEDSYKLTVNTDMTPDKIIWSPTEGLTCSNCLITYARPLNDQQYIVEITDKEGCIVRDTVELRRIINLEIDIPNIFSPDGDGMNDRFYAKCNDCNYIYTMHIFDRWGEKVFYAENIKFNDNSAGWDGRFREKKINPGVFVYLIEIDNGNGEKEVMAGDVLLIK
ncbi:MAG: gliding motility-associated C-terminal domain-containing protein [Saprospiraceae bacterium]|nr:gliding motility-associated C-terminal domain-containing protein [Saprospiraceae bacterium]